MTSPTASVTPRSLWSAAVALGVLSASVLVWYAIAWRWHNSWYGHGAAGLAAFYLPPLALVMGALIVERVLKARQRPAAFEVTGGAFVAPAATWVATATAAAVLTLATGMATLHLRLRSDSPPISPAISRVIIVCLVAAFLVKVAALARQSGRIELRPVGVRLRSLFGVRDLSWEQLAARPGTELADGAWIRPEFLAAAIEHYLTVPAARDSIGTPGGYEWLRRALGAD
ncbi:hypothetical protein [Dactylosporangium sp. NPDC000521]|uniref:hypothetical protein n=1 Tax=Dactylosporangium sp. NPDC000521 TaxID=3363975 RepID=UPI00368D2939